MSSVHDATVSLWRFLGTRQSAASGAVLMTESAAAAFRAPVAIKQVLLCSGNARCVVLPARVPQARAGCVATALQPERRRNRLYMRLSCSQPFGASRPIFRFCSM